MQTWRMVLAMLNREVARLSQRVEMAEQEREKLLNAPVAAQDGDDTSQVEVAKQIDRIEYELDMAMVELRAVRTFGTQLQEVLGIEPEERPERNLVRAKAMP